MKSCFFIGHRDAPSDIFPALSEAVQKHILCHGVTEFIVGQYGSFDRMAARAVSEEKAHHPEITLTLLLPYHPAERPVSLPEGFDGSFYPPGMEKVPRRLAILMANRYMVDHADFLVAYARHPGSNAKQLAEYAQKRETRQLIRVTLL